MKPRSRRSGSLIKCSSRHAHNQQGFVLLAVVLMLAMLATIAFMLNHQVSIGVNTMAAEIESDRARYVAEAGLQQGLWEVNSANCGPYADLATTAFGEHSYQIAITPNNSGGTLLSYSASVSDDAFIQKDDPAQNFGSDASLEVYYEWFQSKDKRALYRFDLDATGIASDATVVSAVARIYVVAGDSSQAVTVRRITAAWDENSVNWDSINADFDITTISSIPKNPPAGQYVEVNLTAEVQGWLNGSLENHGITLMPSALSNGNLSSYASKEFGVAGRPELIIKVSDGSLSNRADIFSTGTLSNGVSRRLTRRDVILSQSPTTVEWQPGNELEDVYVWDGAHKDKNFGVSAGLDIKSDRNILIRFAMEALPPGARVLDAKLSLYGETGNFFTQGVVDIHRMNRDWVEGIYDDETPSAGEGATYETFDGGNVWSNRGGDFDPNLIDRVNFESKGFGWYEWDISSVAQGWLSGEPNYGVLLRESPTSGIDVSVTFTSSDSSNATQRPRLLITLACECGVSCQIPQGEGKVLMVVGDATVLDEQDAYKKSMFEGWGFSVNLIDDDNSQTEFNSEMASHGAVYLSETVNGLTLGGKVSSTNIGVVSEEGYQNNQLGIATGYGQSTGFSADLVDNSHFITEHFATGVIPIFSQSMESSIISGNSAPGLQVLANFSGSSALAVLDAGSEMESGGSAPGRRTVLPIGRNDKFNWQYLNNNGRLMVQRALSWSQGNECSKSTRKYRIRSGNNDAEEFENGQMYLDSSDIELTQDPEFGGKPQLIGLRFTDIDIPPATIITQASLEFVANEVDSAETSLTIYGHDIDNSSVFLSNNTNISNRKKTDVNVPWTELPAWTTQGEAHASPDLSTIVQSIVDRAAWQSGNAMSFIITGTGDRVAYAYESSATQAALLTVTACNLPGVDLGPIAHWPLDEINGDVAMDIAGSHTGTVLRAEQWTPGQVNGGLHFNGVDQFIDVVHDQSLSLTEEMSFSAWIKTNDVSIGNRTIVSADAPGNGASNYWFGITQDELSFGFWADGRLNTVTTDGVDLQAGSWHHLAATFDNATNTVLLYVDGLERGVGELTDEPTVEAANVLIGTSIDNEYWHGALDEVRIYNRVLDITDVTELAVRSERGPIAHWMLNETAGTLAEDSAGHHDGTLTNGPTWAPAKLEGGLRFDGSNDHVLVANHSYLALDEAFTITAWVNNESASVSASYRVMSKETNGANDSYWLALSGGKLYFGVAGNFFGPVGNFVPNQWYHLAATFDDANDSVRIYIDGTEVLNQFTTAKLVPNTDPLYIGANWQTKYWDGLLDDVRLYDTALSETAIGDIVAGTDPVVPEGGASEESSTTDEGGSGCNGTFRDEFNQRLYDQNNGSLMWSGNWVETGEAIDPTGGDIRIGTDTDNYQLLVRDDGQTIAREVDLSTAGSASLSFEYRRQSLSGTGDYVAVEVSYNGGEEWQELDRFSGTATDGSYLTWSEKLDASLLSNNTQIRFLTPSSGMSNSTRVWFDNIEIVCAPNG